MPPLSLRSSLLLLFIASSLNAAAAFSSPPLAGVRSSSSAARSFSLRCSSYAPRTLAPRTLAPRPLAPAMVSTSPIEPSDAAGSTRRALLQALVAAPFALAARPATADAASSAAGETVLVVGARGCTGEYVVKELEQQGAKVRATSRETVPDSYGPYKNVEWIPGKPATRNPQPSTLNPQPATLNPGDMTKPETLTPALVAGVSRIVYCPGMPPSACPGSALVGLTDDSQVGMLGLWYQSELGVCRHTQRATKRDSWWLSHQESVGTTLCPYGWHSVRSYGLSTCGLFTKSLRSPLCG